MNSKTVIINEQANNRSTIHLYYSEEMHSWISYGYSAYSMRMLAKERGVDTLHGFSTQKQMPWQLQKRIFPRSIIWRFTRKLS